jgi:ribose transport system substrate-binding protein
VSRSSRRTSCRQRAEGSWVAHAGVDDKLNGRVAGQPWVDAATPLVDAGRRAPPRRQRHRREVIDGTVVRPGGRFHEVADPAGVTVIGEEYAGFDAASGYPVAQALITAHRDEGIDVVYAHNDALAVGVIQALEEAGYQPGVDVAVVGGTCHGDLSALEDGKQYGTGLQAAYLEGLFSVNSVARFLATGVIEEVRSARTRPPTHAGRPGQHPGFNFLPNPPVLGPSDRRACGHRSQLCHMTAWRAPANRPGGPAPEVRATMTHRDSCRPSLAAPRWRLRPTMRAFRGPDRSAGSAMSGVRLGQARPWLG